MALTITERETNHRVLDSIYDSLLRIKVYHEPQQRVNYLLEQANKILEEQALALEHDVNCQTLKLLLQHYFELEKLDEKLFLQDLQIWMTKAKVEANQIDESTKLIYNIQPTGILQTLATKGSVAEKAEGDDSDINALLEDEMVVDPKKDITKDGTYILRPDQLDDSASLAGKIDEVRQLHPDKNLFVMSIVSYEQRHWRVAYASLNKGEMTQIGIWDPRNDPKLKESSVYKKMEEVRDQVVESQLHDKQPTKQKEDIKRDFQKLKTEKKIIEPETMIEGKVGVPCMDQCVQKVLRVKSHNNQQPINDRRLAKIAAATTSIDLRDAVIGKFKRILSKKKSKPTVADTVANAKDIPAKKDDVIIPIINADSVPEKNDSLAKATVSFHETKNYMQKIAEVATAASKDTKKKWEEVVSTIDEEQEKVKLAQIKIVKPSETMMTYFTSKAELKVKPAESTQSKQVVRETQEDLDWKLAYDLQQEEYASSRDKEQQEKLDLELAQKIQEEENSKLRL